MKKQKLQIVVWAFIIGCILIGVYISGKEADEYSYYSAIVLTVGTVLGIVIYSLLFNWNKNKNKNKNGNVPDVDERTVILIQRYFMIALYVVLFGSAAALLILYAMGVHSIETGMLMVYLTVLFMLIGVGTIVTKRL
ncbi:MULTISPECIES: hypothetical protein [Clostridium]|uniref:DUF2178 domain-containing protein n=1 Tax=Clostridium frigoriphilum TaxID=443253 RepID=A0ABU7UTE3_9CLOT|nr:hypothetical protein [Clostridium sp. DSM 17811]MBU3102164.1 hypothetical protein [Clostridium sp. DSM 17811]